MNNVLAAAGSNVKKNQPEALVPSYCCFVVTLRCMMKCKMCYIWQEKNNELSELSIQEWKNVISSLKGFLDEKHDIILSGGEPFLKKGVLDLVSFSTKAGYRISLDTNAYLLDKELAKAIRDSGLWRICISLDSLDEGTHDFLRGKTESYHRVMRAIEYLHRFCPSVGINIQTVIMEQNINEITKIAEWVKNDERLEYIYFQAIVRPFGSMADDHWINSCKLNFLWPKNTNYIKAVVNDLISLKESNSKIVNSVSQLKIYASYFENPAYLVKNAPCAIGNRDININPYGDVYLCFSKDTVGNVKNDETERIWYSDKAAKIRQMISHCNSYCHFMLNCSFEENSDAGRVIFKN